MKDLSSTSVGQEQVTFPFKNVPQYLGAEHFQQHLQPCPKTHATMAEFHHQHLHSFLMIDVAIL
jgi:hypothetical protein